MKPLLLVLILLLTNADVIAQSDEIIPGSNLVTSGIPSIPTSLAEQIDRYTNFRSAVLASWHPTKREMLINTRFTETTQVHQVKFPGGARTQLTFFRQRVDGGFYHPKDGRYFIFRKDAGGDEFYQLYRYDLDTGNTMLITDGGKSRNESPLWSNSGELLAYSSTKRNGKDMDLYVVDPLVRNARSHPPIF